MRKRLAVNNRPYVIAGAVVGLSGLQKVVYTTVMRFSKRNIPAFDDIEAAKDWLIAQVERMRAGGSPYVLPLGPEQSTALEELCAMNIRFTPDGKVKPEHAALDALSTLVLENY